MGYRIVNGTVLVADGRMADVPVWVDGGIIASVDGSGGDRSAGLLNAKGLLVLPGIIDIHGDGFERSLMPRPGVSFSHAHALAEVDRLLVSHGITTAYLGLTVSWEPGLRSLEAGQATVLELARMRHDLACDLRIQIRWETFALDALEIVKEWLHASPPPLVAFNDHTTQTLENRTDPTKLKKWAERSGLTEEDYLRLVERVAGWAERVPEAVSELAAAARRAGIIMLSHDDRTTASRDYYRGLGATVAEFPLTTAAIEDARAYGEHVVLGAPNVLRGGSHVRALAAADMVEAGLCTVLASDYYYPSLLAAPFQLKAERGIALERSWSLISANAADAAGLTDRGCIEHGRRADVILVDPDCRAGPQVVATLIGGQLRYLSRDVLERTEAA